MKYLTYMALAATLATVEAQRYGGGSSKGGRGGGPPGKGGKGGSPGKGGRGGSPGGRGGSPGKGGRGGSPGKGGHGGRGGSPDEKRPPAPDCTNDEVTAATKKMEDLKAKLESSEKKID